MPAPSPGRRVVRAANVSAERLQVALDRRPFVEEALAERGDLLPRGVAAQPVGILRERLRGLLQLLLRLLRVRRAAEGLCVELPRLRSLDVLRELRAERAEPGLGVQ